MGIACVRVTYGEAYLVNPGTVKLMYRVSFIINGEAITKIPRLGGRFIIR